MFLFHPRNKQTKSHRSNSSFVYVVVLIQESLQDIYRPTRNKIHTVSKTLNLDVYPTCSFLQDSIDQVLHTHKVSALEHTPCMLDCNLSLSLSPSMLWWRHCLIAWSIIVFFSNYAVIPIHSHSCIPTIFVCKCRTEYGWRLLTPDMDAWKIKKWF